MGNYRHIPIPGDSAFVGGAAISPNSRYLYISSQVKFYQYDLQAPDIAASQVLLGEYDGYVSPFATTFYNCQLAPDCKIYCNCYNSCDVFHVVNYPDEPGLSCDFVQHGVQLASSNALSIPNFPNYRLGTGQSVCTPTTTEDAVKAQQLVRVYPNPTNHEITLALELTLLQSGSFQLFTLTGQAVRQWEVSAGQPEQTISLEGLTEGLYFWRVGSEGRVMGSGKLIISK